MDKLVQIALGLLIFWCAQKMLRLTWRYGQVGERKSDQDVAPIVNRQIDLRGDIVGVLIFCLTLILIFSAFFPFNREIMQQVLPTVMAFATPTP